MSLKMTSGAALQFVSMCAGAFLFSACSGQAVVGEENPEGGDGDGDSDSHLEPIECTGDAEANQPPSPAPNDFANVAGTVWEGYYEGGDDVTLVLGSDGTGTFLVGEGRDFDPPTDPNVGYLCDRKGSPLDYCYQKQLWEGYHYSVEAAEVENRRLQFQVVLTELWDDWCGLQTPQRLSPGSCSYGMHALQDARAELGPDACYLGAEDDPAREQVDCGFSYLMLQPTCTCNSQECFGSRDMEALDLTFNEEFTELSNLQGLRLFLVE